MPRCVVPFVARSPREFIADYLQNLDDPAPGELEDALIDLFRLICVFGKLP
jgi:hypothetical protein